MVFVKNAILKGARGAFGELVIYQLNGETVIRSKPRRREVPYSEGQRGQQERISSAALLYRAAKAAGILESWQCAARGTGLPGYNCFLRSNLPAFTGEGIIGDMEKLQLSCGTLELPDKLGISPGEAGEWVVTWENRSAQPGTRGDDRLVAALMKGEEVFTLGIFGGLMVELPSVCHRSGRISDTCLFGFARQQGVNFLRANI